MDFLPVTSLLAALLAPLMLLLTMLVSLRRVTLGKAHGNIYKYPYQDGGDAALQQRIRAFGNFAEYTPTCLILLALMEGNGVSPMLVWWLGLSFIVGRVLHAGGMLSNPHFALPRILGMFATYAVLLVGSASLILKLL